MFRNIAVILILACAALAQVPVPALPEVYIDTTYNSLSGGQTWAAHTSTDFRNALNSAQPGDTIVLDAGTIYSGNFILPVKFNPSRKWIYIQSSALSALPAPGTRVSPSDGANMPKIVTPNASTALVFNGSYVRLVGVEMYSTSTYLANPTHTPWPVNGFAYYLVTTPGSSHITIDRCYLHGSDTEDVNHGIGAYSNASYIAVVDSYISDIHGGTFDSQTFLACAAPGPFKLVDNYLSASTENVMFGGSGGYSNTYVPADIEIRNNLFDKPESWLPQTQGTTAQWTVKDHLECKSCLRMVVTGNTLQNAWVSADQYGENIVLTPRTYQSGYTAVVDDITIENNILQNANMGFSLLGYDTNCLPANGCTVVGESKRLAIENNLILTRDPASQGSYESVGFSLGHRMDSLLIEHNTLQGMNGSQTWASVYFSDAMSTDHPTNVWILDNVWNRQPTGDHGYQGQQALDTYMPLPAPDGPRFLGNVMYVPVGDQVQTWPVDNDATPVPLTFVNVPGGNYQLVSPDWTDTSDGQISGVNNSTLP